MKVTYYGHSCFGIEYNGVSLLLDPFITPNELAREIDLAAIRPQYILVSHGHSDHVADVEKIGFATGATVVSSYEIASYYGGKGLPYHPMNIGGQWDFGKFRVKAVQAVHSSVLPDGTYAGNPMGFVITGGDRTVYYSGDTALHTDMQLIGQKFRVDVAFLCLGDNFTMGIEDAVSAAGLVRADFVVGMHFDTFPYIRIDHDRAQVAFREAGKQLLLPTIGQSFEI